MEQNGEIYDAREVLREAQQALDAIANPARSGAVTDAEEDIIEAARRAWEHYLRLVERQFGHTHGGQHRAGLDPRASTGLGPAAKTDESFFGSGMNGGQFGDDVG